IEFDWDVSPHSSYFPDTTLFDYYLILLLKNFLCIKRFSSINDIKMHLEQYFISKPQKVAL
ncbi:hypothetical protein WN51_02482, partial [Melipona quadrifasciata]